MPVADMYPLTLQIHTGHAWHDAMQLTFEQPTLGLEGTCSYGYKQAYLVDALDVMGSRLSNAVSATLPWAGISGAFPMPPPFSSTSCPPERLVVPCSTSGASAPGIWILIFSY